MAIREIRKKGDPCLEKVCHPVTEFNERLHLLLDDMRETLEESGGVGLAAPQVGILRRVCIVEDSEGEIIELVNPEIVKAEGEQTGLEGCLSLPGRWGIRTRDGKPAAHFEHTIAIRRGKAEILSTFEEIEHLEREK